jgi:N-acetylglucosamine-6-sulfatase
MERGESRKRAGWVARVALPVCALLATLSLPGVGAHPPASAPRRPNVILILTDDLDSRSVELLPRIQALLAKEGATFANMFVTDSLCCPSRASILTGQYAHSHGIRSNNPPLGGFPKFRAEHREISTVATWLHAAGYMTALEGKYLNAYPDEKTHSYVPQGWDEWGAVFSGHGSDNYLDYEINANGRVVEYDNRPEDYETDVLAQRCVDFLKRASAKGSPFFLYVAPSAPHLWAIPAARHADAFPGVKAPRPPSFDEEDMKDKPKWVRGQDRLSPTEIRKMDKLYRKRLQTMLAVEDMLERILKELEADGQLDNTYVFFSSDNGFFFGEHRFPHGKGTPYEESIRVPLFVRGPGVPKGVKVDYLALNIDFAPTLVELAGASGADFVEGRSLVPLLRPDPPPAGAWRKDFLVEHWSEGGDGFPGFAALRTMEGLYAEYDTGERELYDLARDPYELKNLVPAAAPGELKALADRLASLKACSGARCRD